jgi:3-dehydroquinate synthase
MERIDLPFSIPATHRICFTHGAFAPSNPLVRDLLESGGGRRALVYLEDAVAEAWPQLRQAIELYFVGSTISLQAVRIETGAEVCKATDALVQQVWEQIEKQKIDRHSYVIAIGGGAFLDAVGFGAATAHRGVRLVRFPTTTLSQDDSGVGVKNGINAFGKKNWIGSFSVPYAVINDFDFLHSQSVDVCRLGLIEAIKVALVKDADFFHWIEENATLLGALEKSTLEECVKRSALWHARHITSGGDPFEMGSSRPLDFGHWAAHKLEQLSGFSLTHAAAVSVGLWLDVCYSVKAGLLDAVSAQRIGRVLETMAMPMFDELLLQVDARGELAVLAGLEEFREHLGGQLTVLQLRAPGHGVDVHEMNPTWIREAIEEMKSAYAVTPGLG